MKVKLVSKTVGAGEFEGKSAEDIIVYIARVSSNRKDKFKDIDKLINYLIKHKHWSPFEHGFMTVEVETSMPIAKQILRHRSMYFQEFSLRYANIDDNNGVNGDGNWDIMPEFRKRGSTNRQSSLEPINPNVRVELPNAFVLDGKADDVTKMVFDLNKALYDELINKNVANETARFVLPVATKTKMYITGNIRSWIHFLQVRLDKHAQKEIRELSEEMVEIFKNEFPIVYRVVKWFETYKGNMKDKKFKTVTGIDVIMKSIENVMNDVFKKCCGKTFDEICDETDCSSEKIKEKYSIKYNDFMDIVNENSFKYNIDDSEYADIYWKEVVDNKFLPKIVK